MEKKAKKQAEEKAFVQHSGRLVFNTLLNCYSTTLPENTRGCQIPVNGLTFKTVQPPKTKM